MKFVCSECGEEYGKNDKIYKCECGGVLELGEKDVSFPKDKIKQRNPSIWRYREAIPIESDKDIVTLGEGFTPLVPLKIGGLDVMAKLDFMFPTGSFKDRGSSVMISHVKGMGVREIIEDSSGNAGASVSAYSAKAGISCEIFCPSYASKGKLAQIQLYGAKLNKVEGSREDAEKAVLKKAETVYYASHNWNPYFLEGTKTLAFEIAEQLGWKSPENVICPCGNGGIYLGLYIGFKELIEQEIVSEMPRLFGVQSFACPPLYEAYKHGKGTPEPFTQTEKTIAEGVCLAKPNRGKEILEAVKESKGAMEIVNDDEVIEGLKMLASQGVFVEPTSAIVVKALEKSVKGGLVKKDEKTVMVLSGSGLKATGELSKMFRV
ncbi:MAG: threonine synthase [Candidatus Aenigmarchaeota archaeon]